MIIVSLVEMAKLLIFLAIISALTVKCFDISLATCGQGGFRPNHLSDRIVGGHPASSGSWPWMASLTHKLLPGYRFCGASLITDRWAVSAAHCFKLKLLDESWILELGKYDKQKDENYTRYYDVVQVITHPNFNDSDGVFNDIVLLQLNDTINFADFGYKLNEICMTDWRKLETINRRKCYSVGWGRNRKDGEIPERLQQVPMPLVDADKCFQRHGFAFDANTQICAGGTPAGGSGTCHGDSGSPLQCYDDQHDRWHLVGITSFGRACALPDQPDVFTLVAAYSDWIEETIQPNKTQSIVLH